MRVHHDYTGVDREGFAPDDPFFHAARHNGLEQLDHQLRINRGPPHVAIVEPQMRPNLRKVDEPVDLAKQVIVGDMPLEAEAVEQRLLHHPPLAHYRPNLLHPAEENQRQAPQSSRVFQRNLRSPDGWSRRLAVIANCAATSC
jgi:hypothetical protein